MTVTLPDPHFLLIDDEPANVALLAAILQRAGYSHIRQTTDPREGVQMALAKEPDIILLDLSMPHLDGYAVMGQIRAAQAAGTMLPILILTADINPQARKRALTGGATDFVTKPFDNEEVLQRCRNLLAIRALHLQLQDQNTRLEETVRQRTADLERTLSELRATQQQQVQQERLRALGEMSSGVAHDFNNQLTVLIGYSDLLLLNNAQILSNKPMALRYLQTLQTAARDSAGIVGRLREFSRRREAVDVFLPLNLPNLAREAARLTQPRWSGQARAAGATINVRLELEPVPDVSGNAAELHEVVTNLIFNAVDAMPEGGTITLRTRRGADDTVLLEVADTGIGMSDEIRRRCLEPFFTTKEDPGSGLGLSVAYGIVKRHEGELEILTAPGHGATVCLRLAAVPPILTSDSETSAADVPRPGGPLTVLVVEDDPMVLEVISEYLRRDGHEVCKALSGREGLEKFEANRFDLVVTDLALKEMTGEHLAVAIKERNAAMPVILLTGFADTLLADRKPEGIDVVLRKPLQPGELWRAMAQVMGTPAPQEEPSGATPAP